MKKNKNKIFWIYYNSFKISDCFCVEEFGRHVNAKGYRYTETRSNNIFHIVTKGVCYLTVKNGNKEEKFTLKAGEGFLMKSGSEHTYVSDKADPCTRVWIAFTGSDSGDIFKSLGIDEEHFIFRGIDVAETESLFDRLFENTRNGTVAKFNVLSVVMRFFAMLSEIAGKDVCKQTETAKTDHAKEFVDTVVKYIDSHIKDKLSVADLASLFNYETSYFHKLFKKYTGVSVQKFIVDRRIHLARELCVETDLPFMVIASDLGYVNYVSFYRAFVNITHSSPEDYRKTYSKIGKDK